MSDSNDTHGGQLLLIRRNVLALFGAGSALAAIGSGTASVEDESIFANWSLDEGAGESVLEAVSGTESDVSHKGGEPYVDPVWLDGVDSGSLLFDGYSTHTTIPADQLAPELGEELEAFTIDVWVAPRGFIGSDHLNTIVEKKDRSTNGGFVLGVDEYGAWEVGVGLGDSWETLRIAGEDLLPVYSWVHLTVVFDGTDGQLRLYRDGDLVGETDVGEGTVHPADVDLRIGKNRQQTEYFGWELDYFNGAVGQVELYERAFGDQEVADKHDREASEVSATDYQTLAINPEQFAEQTHRPQFHAMPPEHWMNEPHAPFYFDGKYHLFYQGNLHGPYWYDIHWGHWVSDDMVHWEPVDEALRPGPEWFDAEGCWSGDVTIDPDGIPTLVYTAGPEGEPQAIAHAKAVDPDDPDLSDWEKEGIVLEQPDDPELVENEFRDPHVWREADDWYMLVGSALEDGSGTALLFHSTDLGEWHYEGKLHRLADPDEYEYLGDVWELPVLLPVGTDAEGIEKHVFFINPVGGDAETEVYYWTGYWDNEAMAFEPDYEEPKRLDYGDGHFTGPSGRIEPQGDWVDHDPDEDRALVFTIAQDYRLPDLQAQTGWAHNAGTPVELSLQANDEETLAIAPYDEIATARTEQLLERTDATPAEIDDELAGIDATTVELQLEIESETASEYGFYCRRTPDDEERTLVYYDEDTGEIRIDRTETSSDGELMEEEELQSNLTHATEIDTGNEPLRLHVVIDKSMLEVYINGINSVTTRMYPSRDDAQELQLYHDGDVRVKSIELWEMDDIWRSFDDRVAIVKTTEATDVTDSAATLNGELTVLEVDEAECYFQWREVGNNEWLETDATLLDAPGEFDELIDGLESETNYEFRTVVDTDTDYNTGTVKTFQTTIEGDVAVETSDVTDIEETSATLNGELIVLKVDEAECYFQWREVGDDKWLETGASLLTTPGDFEAVIDGLESETDYEFRAFVETGDDYETGTIETFQTAGDYPTGDELVNGEVYTIKNYHSDKLLDIEDSGTGQGDYVVQWPDHGSASQKWIAHDLGEDIWRFENVNSRRSLDVEDASLELDAHITQWEWWGGNNQQWIGHEKEIGVYELENSHSGHVLDVEDDSNAAGAYARQDDAANSNSQTWIFETTTINDDEEYPTGDELVDGEVYTITNYNSGHALAVEDDGTDQGDYIVQRSGNGNVSQKWIAHDLGEDIWRFENVYSGWSLDVEDASIEEGAHLFQWEWWEGANQQWISHEVNTGVYELENLHSGHVLDVEDGSNAAGAYAKQYASHGGNSQTWVFETTTLNDDGE